MLKLGVVGAAKRHAERKRHEQGPRRLHLLGVLSGGTGRRRGDARLLQGSGQHTAGVRAVRSGGRDEGEVHTLVTQAAADRGAGLALDPRDLTLRAHEGIAARPEPAQLAPRDQLAQPIDWERDVDVAHGRYAIEANARVALDDVDRRRVRGDHAIALITGSEQPVAASMEAGGGDDRQAAGGERLRETHERRRLVDLRREGQQIVTGDLGQPVEPWHRSLRSRYTLLVSRCATDIKTQRRSIWKRRSALTSLIPA